MSVRNHASRNETDVAIIGGGLVGMSLAYGLLRQGKRVTVFDEGDQALRASRGNFGLVWVQGKGDTCPEYAQLSRLSARLWPELAASLQQDTGIDIELQQGGGLYVCLDQQSLQQRADMLAKMQQDADGDYPFEVLNAEQAREKEPALGPDIAGATWSPMDGHLNPLLLFRALHQAFELRGGNLVNGQPVQHIQPRLTGGFDIQLDDHRLQAGKVILAAGLGNKALAPQLGLHAPVEPNRGQVLITERLKPFISYPTGHVRQTGEGTVQLGDSKEDVGLNTGTTAEELAKIAARAIRMYPVLEKVRLIRSWGALRVMTPDGYPIYQQSAQYPGAYVVTCHSGVTLGAVHAGPLVDWLLGKDTDIPLEAFSADRFPL
ncbi:NAD(P)/FAD-dependent oxidoreductase [Oceanisphaera arctica]|uniref:FAD-dependent oxidoreductase n=2 Tax=Oceanisphaera arctica TaxID=641510 RepID=A0A2P5TJB9_9GAMM|nr:FAD-dependent oxidoreductase [Oceanisphaera arctica]PPL15044.1 FAD-dependent oxidoreductase [Oceanisphaera arctica]GHA15006.1 FAD-dependent oxidoreductase [Oceanisphaera arctica]